MRGASVRGGGCATVANALAVLAFSGEWPVSTYGAGQSGCATVDYGLCPVDYARGARCGFPSPAGSGAFTGLGVSPLFVGTPMPPVADWLIRRSHSP